MGDLRKTDRDFTMNNEKPVSADDCPTRRHDAENSAPQTEFKRENRYIVLKKTDVHQLDPDDCDALRRLVTKVERSRLESGKNYLACVVVESDWPEYELVWKMIEARMTGKPNSASTVEAPLEPVAKLDDERGGCGAVFWLVSPKTLPKGATFYLAPPDAAALIAAKDAEIAKLTTGERLRNEALDECGRIERRLSEENDKLRAENALLTAALAAANAERVSARVSCDVLDNELAVRNAQLAAANAEREADKKECREAFETWVCDQDKNARERLPGDDWIDDARSMLPAFEAAWRLSAALRGKESGDE